METGEIIHPKLLAEAAKNRASILEESAVRAPNTPDLECSLLLLTRRTVPDLPHATK